MRPAAVAQQQILIKTQLLDLNQQQWILSYFVDKAALSLAVIQFPGGRGRCLLGKSNTREPGQWSDQRNSYISLVFAAAPNTVHAKLEALHARMHTTKQMHQKGLLQAAAANGVWPILKSSINEGGEAQLDRFPSIITTAKPLLVFGNAWLKQLVLRENTALKKWLTVRTWLSFVSAVRVPRGMWTLLGTPVSLCITLCCVVEA